MAVELYLNDQLVDLEGDETIACSYSIAPIADISKRTSTRSVTFKLPKTSNNLRVTGNANVLINSTTIPYSLIKARLYSDGIDQKIRFAEIDFVKDSISVRLYGKNIGFFALIKGKKLVDLDLTSYRHDWTLANIIANINKTSGFVYSLYDMHSDNDSNIFPQSTGAVDVRYWFPSVFRYSLVEKIISEAGYTVQGDFQSSNTNYRSTVVPCLQRNFDQQFLLIKGTQTADLFISDDLIFIMPLDEITGTDYYGLIQNGTVAVVNYLGVNGNFDGYFYEVYADGEYTIQYNWNYLHNTPTPFTTVALVKQPLVGDAVQLAAESVSSISYVTDSYTGSFLKGDKIFIFAGPLGATDDEFRSGGFINVQRTDVDKIQFLNEFDVGANLPDITQADFLKIIAQEFALFIDVDEENKDVYLRPFDDVVNNKSNAVDWSDKVDWSEDNYIAFKDNDYAQINTFTYKEDETVSKPQGADYDLIINDQTLKPQKKLVESPFAACQAVTRLGTKLMANIKIFTGAGTADQEEDRVVPRVLIATEQSTSQDFKDGTTTTNVTAWKMSRFIDPIKEFNLGWRNSLIETNYTNLIATLQSYKVIREQIRLNASDINQLDFFKPVWLDKHNAYFYISEIKQFKFTENEPTEVELVKLT